MTTHSHVLNNIKIYRGQVCSYYVDKTKYDKCGKIQRLVI